MGLVGGEIGYRLLRQLVKVAPGNEITTAYGNRSKMEVFFGPDIWKELRNKTVIDFGCEGGVESVDMAQHGVGRVIGIDIRETALEEARARAKQAGLEDRCLFTTHYEDKADVVVTLDAFEHFSDPSAMLRVMRGMLKDDGYVLACFGPTWYHPLGGHGFSIFPWAHVVFTESVLMRWYREESGVASYKFTEVIGGLNKLTVSRFVKVVSNSDFKLADFQPVPIRKLKLLANRFTREFTTAVVKCKLIPKHTTH
jgi:SAM-dependent methyltransferase